MMKKPVKVRARASATETTTKSAAQSKHTSSSVAKRYPWFNKRRDKNTEQFNLRLSEAELEKLRYIALHTPYSMQAFIREVLVVAIDGKISEIVSRRKTIRV